MSFVRFSFSYFKIYIKKAENTLKLAPGRSSIFSSAAALGLKIVISKFAVFILCPGSASPPLPPETPAPTERG